MFEHGWKNGKEKQLSRTTLLGAGSIVGMLKLLPKQLQKYLKSGFVLANGQPQRYLTNPNPSVNRTLKSYALGFFRAVRRITAAVELKR